MLKKAVKNSPSYSRIGLRISLYAVILSLLFSAVSISILIYIESKQEKTIIIENAKRAIHTVEKQIAKDLWDIDHEGIKITLNSLAQLPSIRGVRITSYTDEYLTTGDFSFPEDIKQDIIFNDEEIGVLLVNYNHKTIGKSLYSKYKMMGLTILVIVCLMGFIFYTMVNQSLIKHIAYISNTRKTTFLTNKQEYVPLSLQRQPRKDELSDLIGVLNEGKKTAVELFKAKKEYQQQMEYQANFDLLTGLPNRRHLYNYLQTNIKEYHEKLGKMIVMFVDLDGFKQVNDSMGHSVGDKVLQECALRLKNVANELDGYISRLGGDEFIICFYTKNDIEEQPKQVIGAFDEKINTNGINVKLGCSIGIATYPDNDFDDPKQLIRNADSALYKAKDAGRNTFSCFNEDIRKELVFERRVQNKLMEAIENKKFEIYYQPLMNIQTNTIVGFEALLRWNDEELGFVPPDIFISIAEKMGVIFDIDTWVFEHAVQQVSVWRKAFNEPFIVSVNFSPTNFYHGNFYEWINGNGALKNKNLDWIELEVTERLVLNDDPIVFSGIKSLRDRGIQFSIDDFGIGYSSLAYIKNFSHVLSKIKIDRMFINEILVTDFDVAFVKSIMMLSDSLGLQVLAEGVEEKGQVEVLRKLGCEYSQGYFFAKPLPVDKMVAHIESQLESRIPPTTFLSSKNALL
jgi:diguanylate cyclase (GGDEF)-like protein